MSRPGFAGIEAEGVEVFTPERKLKEKALSNFQKEISAFAASIRVKVKHTVTGVKRLKIIHNQIRLHG